MTSTALLSLIPLPTICGGCERTVSPDHEVDLPCGQTLPMHEECWQDHIDTTDCPQCVAVLREDYL